MGCINTLIQFNSIQFISSTHEHFIHYYGISTVLRRGRVVSAYDTLIMLMPRRAEDSKTGCEFNPRPGQYSRMSFSSDQVTGTVFPHLNMPFHPNSKFI